MSDFLISKFNTLPDLHQNLRFALVVKDNEWNFPQLY